MEVKDSQDRVTGVDNVGEWHLGVKQERSSGFSCVKTQVVRPGTQVKGSCVACYFESHHNECPYWRNKDNDNSRGIEDTMRE